MKQFYLHVGGHKTGSSAQQIWLAKNTPLLAQAGIAYPTEISGAHGNCLLIAHAWAVDPAKWTGGNLGTMVQFATFLQENADRDILVSAETFSSAEYQDGLAHVAADLKANDFAVTSIMFVRNQVDQLSSLYAQRIKLVGLTCDFSQAIRDEVAMDRADWHRLVSRQEGLGFQVKIGVYRRKAGMLVAESLLDLAGLRARLPTDTDFSVDEVNPSIGEYGVLTGLHLKRWLMARGIRPPHNGNVLFGRALLAASADFADRRFVGPNAADRDWIRARHAAGNSDIARRLPDDEAKLLLREALPDLPASPRRIEDLTTERRSELADYFQQVKTKLVATEDLHRFVAKDALASIPDIREGV